MVHLLSLLTNRLRPHRGWAAFLVILGALLCLPVAITSITRQRTTVWFLAPLEPMAGTVLLLTLLATLAGLRAASTRLSRSLALVLSSLLGFGLSAIIVGQLAPSLSLMWSELASVPEWLGIGEPAGLEVATPFARSSELVSRRLWELGARLWWDVQSVIHGGSLWETQAYLLMAAFLSWALAFFATWQVYRQKSALAALLPSGLFLAVVVLYHPEAAIYLIVFLLCALLLNAASNLWVHWDRWQETHTDYPDDLGQEVVFRLGPWVLLLIVLAGFFPTRGFGRVSRAFWEQAENLFGPLEGEQWKAPYDAGSLPRAHLLGGGPELSESVVFYVTTNDPPPLPPDVNGSSNRVSDQVSRYWRGETFDIYTGLGWATSPLEVRNLTPGSNLFPDAPQGIALWQRFEVVSPGSEVVYAANEPYQVDQPVQTWWRGPNDLARITGERDRYAVVSDTLEPTIVELQAVPNTSPVDVANLYLALPDSVPGRVHDLAELIVDDAETRFDKAYALETYLRTYTYTLELADPPANRDLVDYFLFDLQQGYCDYYASAMVVLARAVGVPARLASGYVRGTYDYEQERWVVTEKDAHSWVEIYFDGIGWVEFEPTAAEPTLVRAGTGGSPRPDVPPLPPRPVAWWRRIPWVPLALGAALLILVGAVRWLWVASSKRAIGPDQVVRDRFARLLGWGERLGQRMQPGQTPYEYGESLAEYLYRRGQASRWKALKHIGADVRADVEKLTDMYVHAQYGATDTSRWQAQLIVGLWRRLRRRLRRLWLILN